MAKRKPLPPSPDFLRDNPEYRARAEEIGREYSTAIRLGEYMAGSENVYTAFARDVYHGIDTDFATADTPGEALHKLARKLGEVK